MSILQEIKQLVRRITISVLIEISSITKFFRGYSLTEDVKFHQYRACLIQGVDKPYWNLIVDTAIPSARFEHIHEKEFRKIYTLPNWYNVYKSNKSFLQYTWYDIWVNRGIYKGEEYLLWK